MLLSSTFESLTHTDKLMNIDPDQIAELISTKLASDPAFQSSLITAIAREATRGPDAELKQHYAAATDTLIVKLRAEQDALGTRMIAGLETTANQMKVEAEGGIRKRFEDAIRAGTSTTFTEEWILKQATHSIRNLILEAFGRRAHEVATEYLSSSTSRMELLLGKE